MKSNEFSVVVEGEVRQSAQGRKPCRCDNCRHILVSGPNRILRIHSNWGDEFRPRDRVGREGQTSGPST